MFLLRPSRIMAVKPRLGTVRTTSARPSFSQIQRSIPAAKQNTMNSAITTSRLNSLLLKTSCSVSKSTKASVKYQCPKCDFQAEDKNDMKNHVVLIHKSKPFVCFHCEETFSNFKVMQSHVKALHPEVGVIKEPYALVSGMDNTKLKGSKKTTLSTKGTSPAPSDQGSLPQEINAVHSSPSLVKSAGKTSSAANDNMVDENKSKPKVKKSRKTSKEEHVLKKLEGIQAVEWQAKNQTQKNLQLEMEVDANNKSVSKSVKNSVMYQCPKCDFQAEDKNDMKNHVVVIHKSKPFVCFHCEETFSNFKVMQSHVKALHPEVDVVKEPYALVSEMENIEPNGSSKTATLSTKGTNPAPSDQGSLPQEIESAVQSSNKARDTTLDQSELKPKGKKMKKTKNEIGITDSEIEAMLKILEEGQKSDSTKSKDNKLNIAEHLNVKAIEDKNLEDEAYLLTKSQEIVLPIKQTLKEKRKKRGKRNLESVTDESAVLQSKAEKEAEERLVMQQMANTQRENEEKLLKEQKEKQRLLEEQKEKEEKLLKEQEKEWLLKEQKEKEQWLLEKQKEKERLLEEKKAMEENFLKEQKEKEEQKLKEQNEAQRLLKEQKEKERLLEEQKEKEKILKENEDQLLKEQKRERLLKEQQLLEEQKAKEEKLLKEQKEKKERKLKEQKEEQLLKELKEKEKLLKEKEEQKEKQRLLEEQNEKEEKEWLLKEQKEKERLLKEQKEKQRLLEEQKDKERLLEEKKVMEEKLLKEKKEKEERKLKEQNEEQLLLKEQKEKEPLLEEQKEKEKILKEKEDQLLKAQKRERLLKEQKEKEEQLLEEQLLEEQKAISNKLFKEKKERELKEQKEEQLLKELKEKEKLLKEKEDQLLKEQKRERLLKEQKEKEQQLEEQKAKEEKLLKEQKEKEERELKEQKEEQLLKEQKEEQRLLKEKEKELSLLKEKKEKAIKTAFQQDIKKELNTDLQGNESGLLNWFKKIISRK